MKLTQMSSWEQVTQLRDGQEVWSVVWNQEVKHDKPVYQGKERVQMVYAEDGALLAVTTPRARAYYEKGQWDAKYQQFLGDGHILTLFLLGEESPS